MEKERFDDLADYESEEENLAIGEAEAADVAKKYRIACAGTN